MRADDQLRLAGGNAFQYRVPFLALRPAGQDIDRDARRRGHPRKRGVVLPRENFRRRHQHSLAAGFDRRQHRHQGHGRLAGADVPLQQPQHAVGSGHVGKDLVDGRRWLFVKEKGRAAITGPLNLPVG